MQHRPLGRSGLSVSVLSLGTMTFGDQNTEAEGHAQLDLAVERGVNLIDAAELYPTPPKRGTAGRTEEIVGSWIKRRGRRDDLVVATKVVGRSDNDWFRADGSKAELSPGQMREALETSLRRLGVDCVDLYQVHWPDRPVASFGSNPTRFEAATADPARAPEHPIGETLAVLDAFLREGKIRAIGLSNESAWGAMTYLKHAEVDGLTRPCAIQNAYSLLNRTFEVNLAEAALREDLPLLAYSPLGQGQLTGKYLGGAVPPRSRKALSDRMQRYEKPGAAEAVRAYVDLARGHGLDPARMALAFAASRPFLASVILGASTVEQLDNDLRAAEVAISPELEAAIDAVHQVHQNPAS